MNKTEAIKFMDDTKNYEMFLNPVEGRAKFRSLTKPSFFTKILDPIKTWYNNRKIMNKYIEINEFLGKHDICSTEYKFSENYNLELWKYIDKVKDEQKKVEETVNKNKTFKDLLLEVIGDHQWHDFDELKAKGIVFNTHDLGFLFSEFNMPVQVKIDFESNPFKREIKLVTNHEMEMNHINLRPIAVTSLNTEEEEVENAKKVLVNKITQTGNTAPNITGRDINIG